VARGLQAETGEENPNIAMSARSSRIALLVFTLALVCHGPSVAAERQPTRDPLTSVRDGDSPLTVTVKQPKQQGPYGSVIAAVEATRYRVVAEPSKVAEPGVRGGQPEARLSRLVRAG
jgi:hypothetical protein